jgi:hypothetical protein
MTTAGPEHIAAERAQYCLVDPLDTHRQAIATPGSPIP